jgi:hypothetical protein
VDWNKHPDLPWSNWPLDYKKGIKKCTLLGLRKLEGHHTGENQAEVVWKLIRNFGLEYKVSTIE